MAADNTYFNINADDLPSLVMPAGEGWIADMDIRYLEAAVSGFAEACIFRVTFGPRIERGRHRHPRATEFLYVIEGHGACGFEASEHAVRPGSLELIPAGIPHWFRNTSDAPVTMLGGYLGVGSRAEAGYEFLGELTEAMRQVPQD